MVRPGLVVNSPASTPDSPSNSGGGGCRGDCTPPTLGVDPNYKRIVEEGFSFNGNPVDVEPYYTPYPLITVNVGQQNTAVFKIYDNSGTQNIQHIALAFGLGTGESFGHSKATISLDRTFDGREIVTVVDPENVLDNISVITEKGPCNGGLTMQCLIVTFYHTFRAPLDFNMVASYVWDFNQNGWNNYYNHGVEVVGESLNPPTVEYIVDRFGRPHALTIEEVTPGMRLDENNSQWILIGDTWQPYTRSYAQIHPETVVDPGTPNSITRNWDYFHLLKESQISLAQQKLMEILGTNPGLNPYLKNNEET